MPRASAPAAPAALPADDTRTGLRGIAERHGTIILIVVALLFPMLDAMLGLGLMNPMLRILTSVMLALGLNIVVGFAGLLDLGYVAFWAIGAYCVGWLASSQFATLKIHVLSGLSGDIPGIHLSIWLIFPIAAVVTAGFGVALGAPTLRLRGDYLAIVTLGFGEIIPNMFRNGDDIAGHNLTNGTAGIAGLDAPFLGGGATALLGDGWGSWTPLNLWPWYYLALALVGLCFYVSVTMQWSKLGRAWMAIREDETAAAAMGIDCTNAKLWAYGIGASLGGIAGVFHGARIGSVFPASFMFYISISVLCMVIIGGMGNAWGAVVGAFVIEGLNFWLLPSLTSWGNAVGLHVDFSSWNMLIFGALLVVMMLKRPQGFVPSKSRTLVFADEGVVHHGEAVGAHAHQVDGHAAPEAYPAGMHGPMGTAGPEIPETAGVPGMAGPPVLATGTEAHVSRGEHAAAASSHEPTTLAAGPRPSFRRFEPGSNPFAALAKPFTPPAAAGPEVAPA